MQLSTWVAETWADIQGLEGDRRRDVIEFHSGLKKGSEPCCTRIKSAEEAYGYMYGYVNKSRYQLWPVEWELPGNFRFEHNRRLRPWKLVVQPLSNQDAAVEVRLVRDLKDSKSKPQMIVVRDGAARWSFSVKELLESGQDIERLMRQHREAGAQVWYSDKLEIVETVELYDANSGESAGIHAVGIKRFSRFCDRRKRVGVSVYAEPSTIVAIFRPFA